MVSLEDEPEHNSPMNDKLNQWPATRGPSLDDEDQTFGPFDPSFSPSEMRQALEAHIADSFSQWPATRGPSVEEDPCRWPATRGPSLEEAPPHVQWPATQGPSSEVFIEVKQQDPLVFAGISREEEVVAWPTIHGLSHLTCFEPLTVNSQSGIADPITPPEYHSIMPLECLNGKASSLPIPSDASTTDSTDEDHSLFTPPSGLSDDEGENQKDLSGTLKISLTDTLGLWSVGSAAHETSTCKPCAFLWKDPRNPGCQNGTSCTFCHLCPPGEVKARKKQKMFMRKLSRNLRNMDQYAMGSEQNFDLQYKNQYAAGYGIW
jgi:hypothetical protein